MTKRLAIYARVSKDEQTVENQTDALREWGERSGLTVVQVYTDEAISGAKGRDKRPGYDAMLKDAQRRKFDVLAVWHVDRLGRGTLDALTNIEILQAAGVALWVQLLGMDTRTPVGRLALEMTLSFAQFERTLNVERTKLGIARARKAGKRIGRAPVDMLREERVRSLLRGGMGQLKAAKEAGVGTSVAQRIARELKEEAVAAK